MGKIESLSADSKAFGSGLDNPHGPDQTFELTDNGCVGQANFDARFQDGRGHVHIGLLSLALDDAMFFAVLQECDSYSMSARLKLKIVTPARINDKLSLHGWVDNIQGRKVISKGEIRRQADNTLVAEGEALFILVKGKEQNPGLESVANISIQAQTL